MAPVVIAGSERASDVVELRVSNNVVEIDVKELEGDSLMGKSPSFKVGQRKKKSYHWLDRESLAGRQKYSHGKPGSRRYQRWINDVFIGRDPTTLFDEGINDDWSDFHNDQAAKSVFYQIHRSRANKRAMQPFLEIALDAEAQLLGDVDAVPAVNASSSKDTLLIKRYRQVLKPLVDSVLVVELSQQMEHVLHLFNNSQRFSCEAVAVPSTPTLFAVSYDASSKSAPALLFMLRSSYDRIVCHSLCSFYGLHSQSVDYCAASKAQQSSLKATRVADVELDTTTIMIIKPNNKSCIPLCTLRAAVESKQSL